MEKTKQKCPRCGDVSSVYEKKCMNCGLVFDKLKYVSNKEAKRCIIRGERHKIIRMQTFPKDCNRWVTILLCVLFGYAGAHNIHVGKYLKGFFSLGICLITAIILLLAAPEVQTRLSQTILLIPSAIVFAFWMWDVVCLAFGKFKVPVALDFNLNSNIAKNKKSRKEKKKENNNRKKDEKEKQPTILNQKEIKLKQETVSDENDK